ncbi:hypothetical protein [Sporanaerobacter sp. PP17-6a]|uniref:hypothetical protein n=1 Tax=Sporanaerobacter sp. PP17-6a TaxID=1891289 RepID=UPI0008A07408|nr:hypothetical protein [Sporanaerobacter sp. PP17-6a]SCL93479.1 hypothetical protein PP176A_2485 [Sporanaerobacter sp. PP17-6a]
MKKTLILIFLILTVINSCGYSQGYEKTIFIVVDQMPMEAGEKIMGENYAGGLINTKTVTPYNPVSFSLSVATGRKVGIDESNFKGLHKNRDGSIKVMGYDRIVKSLNDKYSNFVSEVDFFGEKLKNQGIGYIGNGPSSLIACDKKGNIGSGETYINYDLDWLVDKTNNILKKENILIMDYDIYEENDGIEILKSYLNEYKDLNVILVSRNVADNMKGMLNKWLSLIIYKSEGGENGILTSLSTKREGIVTLLDIFPHVLSIYGLESKTAIGKSFNISPVEKQPMAAVKKVFDNTMGQLWSTYFFHGIIYYTFCYFAYFIVKRRYDKYKNAALYFDFIAVIIFVSFLLGFFNMQGYPIVYILLVLMISYPISYFFRQRKMNTAFFFSTVTYLFMVLGIIFFPEVIYNSFVGFNNIVFGFRYYGFNNGAMGVLLACSIISYFSVKNMIKDKLYKNILLILYFSLNIIALSSRVGANTGGFLASIILFLIMIYEEIFERNLTWKSILGLFIVGFLIMFINVYLDLHSFDRSHAGDLLYRIEFLGSKELWDMVKLKLKELIWFTITPPWCIVAVSQVLSVRSLFKDNIQINRIKDIRPDVYKEYLIFMVIGAISLLINDTGIISSIFMVGYFLISLMDADIRSYDL